MGATYRQNGEAIDFTPATDVASGDVVVQGDLLGVAKLDIKTGVLGALSVEGVFDFPKATGTGTAIASGVNTYWDAVNKVATIDAAAGANKLIGKTIRAAADDDAVVRVLLSQ